MAFARPSLRRILGFLVIVLLVSGIALAYLNRNVVIWALFQIRLPGSVVAEQGLLKRDLQATDFKVLATGLKVPWALDFLPDGSMLVTERAGSLKRITSDGTVIEVKGLDETTAVGEGGLLGLAVHPHFAQNHWVFMYQTTGTGAGMVNRVVRYRLESDALLERTTIVQGIPAAAEHDGGALAFGPDGLLYIGTGDAGNSSAGQDLTSLGGKILRVNDDATIPKGNPFETLVWTYGHRNIEGLTWDDRGRMWSTEHGRSGLKTGFDELNIIESGTNYGWPVTEGDQTEEGMRNAAVHSGPTEPWAPAGVAANGIAVFFGGLRGEALYRMTLGLATYPVKAHFVHEFGRIRAVTFGPDQQLYFTTSNTDGRGLPRTGDDQLIKVNPARIR
jgi:glucose/arabinose dehydrogenase